MCQIATIINVSFKPNTDMYVKCYQMILCVYRLGELERAVRSFTIALQLNPFFLDALISRGNVFMDFAHDIGLIYARYCNTIAGSFFM